MPPEKCPNCGEPVNLPPDFSGGVVTCSTPSCGQAIAIETGGHLDRSAMGQTRRRAGSGPILLDRIPRSFITSPAMIPIGVAIALLYGIVLFGVFTARKQQREAERNEPKVAVNEVLPLNLPDLSEPKTSLPNEPKPVVETPVVFREPEPTPRPAPEPSAKMLEKAEIAASDVPPTKPTEADPPESGLTWGKLQGNLFDCQGRLDRSGLVIEVPGAVHILSTDLKLKNAPRYLMPAQGDFSVSVAVEGDFSPGSDPLPDTNLTFQGAGLLIWSDENNYLRFERTESFTAGGKAHSLLLEVCRNGKTSKPIFQKAREVDPILKIDRKGPEFRCQYMLDGKNWIDFKRQILELPTALSVGVSASNVSPKVFAPRFDDFQVTDPSAKAAKGS